MLACAAVCAHMPGLPPCTQTCMTKRGSQAPPWRGLLVLMSHAWSLRALSAHASLLAASPFRLVQVPPSKVALKKPLTVSVLLSNPPFPVLYCAGCCRQRPPVLLCHPEPCQDPGGRVRGSFSAAVEAGPPGLGGFARVQGPVQRPAGGGGRGGSPQPHQHQLRGRVRPAHSPIFREGSCSLGLQDIVSLSVCVSWLRTQHNLVL